MIRISYATLIACAMLGANTVSAQLSVTPQQTAQQIATAIAGSHVTITNPVLTCPDSASGTFAAGPASNNLGMTDGALFTTGRAATSGFAVGANGAQSTNFASYSNNAAGDPDINVLSGGASSYDACVFECDVKAAYDTLLFDYVFGSEEYDNYSCSGFNDLFGFFISGPGIIGKENLALIPGTAIPVAINSTTDTAVTHPADVTACLAMGAGSPFAQYYNDNSSGSIVTYYGLTQVMRAVRLVDTSATYHLKFVVADIGDGSLDGGVFIKGHSVTSKPTGGFPTNISNPVLPEAAVVPNPFSNSPQLQLPAAWKDEEIRAVLMDATGRLVRNDVGRGAQLEKDFGAHTQDLARGVYFLRLSAPRTGAMQTVKLEKL